MWHFISLRRNHEHTRDIGNLWLEDLFVTFRNSPDIAGRLWLLQESCDVRTKKMFCCISQVYWLCMACLTMQGISLSLEKHIRSTTQINDIVWKLRLSKMFCYITYISQILRLCRNCELYRRWPESAGKLGLTERLWLGKLSLCLPTLWPRIVSTPKTFLLQIASPDPRRRFRSRNVTTLWKPQSRNWNCGQVLTYWPRNHILWLCGSEFARNY
jgi:hypothetical protein